VKAIVTIARGPATVRMEGFDAPVEAAIDVPGTMTITRVVEKPRLWSAEFPNLYTMALSLTGADGSKQRIEQRVGIREITIKDAVLLINGVPVKFAGMCRHDGQGIGTARYFGVGGKLPCPGVVEVISTSGVSPGLSP
jgi:hypothetical protein